jgi:hypothetical protein
MSRAKPTEEERERRRAIVERDRLQKLRRKQLEDFMRRLGCLFQGNDAMKRAMHDEAVAPRRGDKASEVAWYLHRAKSHLLRRKYAAAEAIDEFETFTLDRYSELAETIAVLDDEDEKQCEEAIAGWAASPEGKARAARRAAEEDAVKDEVDAWDRRWAVIDSLLRGDKLH